MDAANNMWQFMILKHSTLWLVSSCSIRQGFCAPTSPTRWSWGPYRWRFTRWTKIPTCCPANGSAFCQPIPVTSPKDNTGWVVIWSVIRSVLVKYQRTTQGESSSGLSFGRWRHQRTTQGESSSGLSFGRCWERHRRTTQGRCWYCYPIPKTRVGRVIWSGTHPVLSRKDVTGWVVWRLALFPVDAGGY